LYKSYFGGFSTEGSFGGFTPVSSSSTIIFLALTLISIGSFTSRASASREISAPSVTTFTADAVASTVFSKVGDYLANFASNAAISSSVMPAACASSTFTLPSTT